MKGYKGFDKDLKCKGGYQYTIGRTETTDEAKLCNTGFHFCEQPLDVFRHFAPAHSRYCEIEAEDVSPETEESDTKRVAKKLTVKEEIGIAGLVKAQIEYVKAHCTHEVNDDGAATAGYSGAATAGYRGAATAGDLGAATAGDYGAATARGSVTVGKDGCGLVRWTLGDIKIRGGMGAILVICAEKKENYDIVGWKAAVVDGEIIKADTWYTLRDGEFVEVRE